MPNLSSNKRNRASSPDILTRSPYFDKKRQLTSLSPFAKPEPTKVLLHECDDDEDVLPTLPLPVYHSTCNNEAVLEERRPELVCLLRRLLLLKPQLIQEIVASDPWKMLVAVTLLNKTSGKLALPIFWEIMAKWPSARHLSNAALPELISILRRIGTQSVRAKRLVALSSAYLSDPPSVYDPRPPRSCNGYRSPDKRASHLMDSPISHLPGVGRYALDSYRIFCTAHDVPNSQEWKMVQPTDKMLTLYLRWKWAVDEHQDWSPIGGVIGALTPSCALSLIEELEHKLLK